MCLEHFTAILAHQLVANPRHLAVAHTDILAVAADGDVMPQKSTYFYPKALTGLVINPHEW